MAKKKIARPGKGWFSRADMAEMFGVSLVHFDRHFRPLVKGTRNVKIVRRRVWFRARPLIDAYLQYELGKVVDGINGHDPLMTVGNSPNLEKYRGEKARLAQLDRLERERELVPREAWRRFVLDVTKLYRSVGLDLEKKFGPDAVELLEDRLQEADDLVEEHFGVPDGNDQ